MKEIDVLTLQLISGTSKVREIFNLIHTTPEIIVSSVKALFELCQQKLNSAIKFSEVEKAYMRASMLVAQAQSLGIKILLPTSSYFPALLKEIKDPPLLLFVKGTIEVLQGTLIAVVGTREPSAYGAEVAYKISEILVQQNIVVVSGLAEGIDQQAHLGCLNAKGKTIAVLAHGLDMVYPTVNMGLAEKIIKSGGCLISEYPPQTKPQKYTFVHRNRIQSGLSAGVIIIESKADGGTMHTANFCLGQHRMLACVDFAEKAPQPSGNTLLLQKKEVFCLKDFNALSLYIDQTNKSFPSHQKKTQIEQLWSGKMKTVSDLSTIAVQQQTNLFLVPEYSQYFIGRERYLKYISSIAEKPTIHTIFPKIILVGMGGSGKTELAIKYAWNNRHLYPGGCFFIDAEHEQYIQESFNSIKNAFGLPDDALCEKNELFIFLAQKGRTLLIYDNVDHSQIESLRNYLPDDRLGFSSASFTIILTSRDQIKIPSVGESILIDPDEESMRKDALEFVNKNLGVKPINQLLVKKLQYLPLALSQAVSYLKQHPTVEIHEYCEQLEQIEKKSEYLSYLPLEGKTERLPVLTTWLLSLEILKQKPEALDILNICAFLSPNDINKLWFIKRHINVDDLLPNLFNYSLLYKENTQRSTFKIHRLLQEVVIITLRGVEIDHILHGLNCMATVTEPYCRSNAHTYAILVPHVQSLLNKMPKQFKNEHLIFTNEMALLFLNVGLYYKDQLLDFKTAEFYLELTHKIFSEYAAIGEDVNQDIFMQSKLHLLKAYISNNKLYIAEQMCEQLEKHMKLNVLQHIELQFIKAQLLSGNKKFDEALQVIKKLLDIPSLAESQKARCLHDLVITIQRQYQYNIASIRQKTEQADSLPQWQTRIKGAIESEIGAIKSTNLSLLAEMTNYFKQCLDLQKHLGNILEAARIYILFLKFTVKNTRFEHSVIVNHAIELYELCGEHLRKQKSPYYKNLVELLCKIFSETNKEDKLLQTKLDKYIQISLEDFRKNVEVYKKLQELLKSKQQSITKYFKLQPVVASIHDPQTIGIVTKKEEGYGKHKRKTPDYP